MVGCLLQDVCGRRVIFDVDVDVDGRAGELHKALLVRVLIMI